MKFVKSFLILSIAFISLSVVSAEAQTVTADSLGHARSVGQQVGKTVLGLPRYGVFDIIKYEVNGGTVTLSGKVYSLGTKSTAAAAVKSIPGVSNVVNNIEELPPSPFDDSIRREALRTFAGNGLGGYFWEAGPDVHIIVDRGNLTLEGTVMNSGDLNRFNIYARGISGVFNVQNNLTVGSRR
jgi:osmotically-inducible protein OsmY